MTNHQEWIRNTLGYWRLERERLLVEMIAYRNGYLRHQRLAAEGWTDLSSERIDALHERLLRIDEVIAFFEGLLAH